MFRFAAITLLVISLLSGLGSTGRADGRPTLTVAAAANLARVAQPLAAAHRVKFPEVDLTFTHGATGSLVAQIRHGAPFDVLLAADLDYPRALIESRSALPDTLVTFAHGTLVLWPRPPGDAAAWPQVLLSPRVRRIAIANPATAPFGRVARDLLAQQGLADALRIKIVEGDNVAQTLQFVHSGNAEYGFVAGSLLGPDQTPGLALETPNDALAHGAVLLVRARNNPAARAFLTWLMAPEAQGILAAHGYRPVRP